MPRLLDKPNSWSRNITDIEGDDTKADFTAFLGSSRWVVKLSVVGEPGCLVDEQLISARAVYNIEVQNIEAL